MKEKAEYKVDLNCKEWLATLLRAEYSERVSVCVYVRAYVETRNQLANSCNNSDEINLESDWSKVV